MQMTGLALAPLTATVSPAAPIVLGAAVSANPQSHEIATRPRGVIDQGNLLCCVSCALASAMEATDSSWPAMAPLFHYYVTRFENAGADTDGSLFLDSGLATLGRQGICRDSLYAVPFNVAATSTEPSPEAYADALEHLLGRRNGHARSLQVTGPSPAAWMREQLDQDRPVVIAFQLPQGYDQAFLNPQNEWRDPNAGPLASNGHCALLTGYSDARQVFHLQDSRGTGRFENGCWWLGYRVVDSPVLQTAYSLIP